MYTTINFTDESRSLSVTAVGVAGWQVGRGRHSLSVEKQT